MGRKIYKITKNGGSKIIVVTNLIPKDWEFVTIEKISEEPKEIILRLRRVEV